MAGGIVNSGGNTTGVPMRLVFLMIFAGFMAFIALNGL
jgi:hypothetical protein